jgi:hypothetical protein
MECSIIAFFKSGLSRIYLTLGILLAQLCNNITVLWPISFRVQQEWKKNYDTVNVCSLWRNTGDMELLQAELNVEQKKK